MYDSSYAFHRPHSTWTNQAVASFELLPADAPSTVRLIHDPDAAGFLAANLKVHELTLDQDWSGRRTIRVVFSLSRDSQEQFKHNLGCAVYLDAGQGRQLIGLSSYDRRRSTSYKMLGARAPLPDGFDATHADIILVPSTDAAERTLEIKPNRHPGTDVAERTIYIDAILNHDEILFEDVEIEW